MTKSNGITSLKQAAKLLNKHSPDGESLAYINPEEARVLRARGGSGIMTLAGVPSYWSFPSWVPFVGDKELGEVAGNVWDWATDRYKNKPATKDDKGNIIPGQSGLGNLAKDALSVWGALRAKKDQEGLNEAEQAEFDRLSQQMASAKTEFDVSTDLGTQLKPEYTTDITEVAAYTPIDFSGSATPDLTTTAVAQGGRIGYNLGSVSGTAYAEPGQGGTGDISAAMDLFTNRYSGDQQTTPSNTNFMTNMISQSSQGPQFQLLNEYQNYVTEVGEENAMSFEEWQVSRDQPPAIFAAQGGRIGAFNGGIQGLMPQQAMPQQGMPQQAMLQQGFMPQQAMPQQAMPQQAMPQRIGFQDTGSVVDTESAEYKAWKNLYTSGNTDMAKQYHPNHETYKKYLEAQGKAQGGRIGYNSGSQGSRYTYLTDKISKGIPLTPPELEELQMLEITYADVDRDPSAQGGRIGYNLGGIDRPFQGVGALNQMGSNRGLVVDPGGYSGDLVLDTKFQRWLYGTHDLFVEDLSFDDYAEKSREFRSQEAQGGRIGAQGGGIMPLLDMGGMEKDYRQEGGFVPIGRNFVSRTRSPEYPPGSTTSPLLEPI